jgi:hypothetical protein
MPSTKGAYRLAEGGEISEMISQCSEGGKISMKIHPLIDSGNSSSDPRDGEGRSQIVGRPGRLRCQLWQIIR